MTNNSWREFDRQVAEQLRNSRIEFEEWCNRAVEKSDRELSEELERAHGADANG